MRNFDHTNINEKISLYIKGRLSGDEIDKLWAELVQDKHYMDYLKTVVNLKRIIEERNNSPIN